MVAVGRHGGGEPAAARQAQPRQPPAPAAASSASRYCCRCSQARPAGLAAQAQFPPAADPIEPAVDRERIVRQGRRAAPLPAGHRELAERPLVAQADRDPASWTTASSNAAQRSSCSSAGTLAESRWQSRLALASAISSLRSRTERTASADSVDRSRSDEAAGPSGPAAGLACGSAADRQPRWRPIRLRSAGRSGANGATRLRDQICKQRRRPASAALAPAPIVLVELERIPQVTVPPVSSR